MNLEMQIIREVSNEAEDFYQDTVDLGMHAFQAFKKWGRKKTEQHRSQMTSLENIAESTFKTSDVFDYIKKQTARHDPWRHAVPDFALSDKGFGEHLRAYLENNLAQSRDRVCERLNEKIDAPTEKISETSYKGKQERIHIYLLLIRQFIRSMVVEYEYQVARKANGQDESES